MSPATAISAPSRATARRPVRSPARRPRPRLAVVVAPASARSRGPFVLTCVGLLAGTLVCLLLLNIALSQGSYRLHDLEQRRALLAEEEQFLSEQVAVQSSPGRLAERAAALGMVPNPSPVFLRLDDGAVLGSPTPATAPPPPPAVP